MRTPLLLALAAGCTPFPLGDAVPIPEGPLPVDHDPEASDEVVEAMEELVLPWLDAEALPSLSVALVHEGSVCYSGGFGWADLENEVPMQRSTPVLLSSVSKTFIGTAAMQGVEAGRLSLDDPAADHLGFALDNPKVQGEEITLYHLLTHHSGIEDSGEYEEHYAEGDPTIPLDAFCEGYLVQGGEYWRSGNYAKRLPGEAFSYCNTAAACGGLAVGNAADMEFMDLVERDLFDPLGMDDSAYLLSDLSTDPAVPYHRTRSGEFRAWPQYGYPTYPDGMIRSSSRDMARFMAAIAGGGELDGRRILEEATVEEMLSVDPALGSDEDGQAVSWAMREFDGTPHMGHNGGDYGSLAEFWFDPETGNGFVGLLNAFPGSWDGVADFERSLLEIAAETCE